MAKPKIAVVIVGFARTFEQTHESFFKNVITPYQDQYDFDFFLLTWNIRGNITKDKNLYHIYQSNLKWLDTEEILNYQSIKNLQHIYKPKTLRIINYYDWKKTVQPKIDHFIQINDLEDHRQVVEGPFCGQYYSIQEGFKDFHHYHTTTQTEYSLVIKTRFDLLHQNTKHTTVDWNKILHITNEKNQIISLQNWVPKGIEDKFLMGSPKNMIQYSKLYDWLMDPQKFTQQDLNQIRITTFYLPDVYMHFNDYQPHNKQHLQHIQQEVIQNLESFRQTNGTYFYPIITERLLRYYLQDIEHIEIYWEEFFHVAIYRSSGKIQTNEAILKRLKN